MQLLYVKPDQEWHNLYADCGKIDDTLHSIKSAWL